MLRPLSLLSLASLLFPLFLQAQIPDLAAVLERLDRLERENRALAGEVQALRAEVAAVRGGSPAQPLSNEERIEIAERRIDEQAQSKVESAQKFPIRITGMALFNAFLNSRQNGGADYPVLASAPGAVRASATMRQSIIGLEYRGPQAILGGKVHGSLYLDFVSTPSSIVQPLGQALRFRTGSIEIDWANRSVMAGVEKPIFNPREPSSLAQVGVSPLTGAGNLWLWLPQVRLEQDISLGRGSGLRAQLGVVQTRETGPYSGSPVSAVPEASRPGLEGRFEFFHKFDDERRLEIAPGFHVSTTHAAGLSVPSHLISVDWFFNPVKRLELSGAFFRGENIAHLGTGGIRQGFDIEGTTSEAVHSQGGWAQLTIHAIPRLDFHLFSGQHDDRNRNLVAGGIGKNLLYGGNLYFRLAPNLLLGPEITQVRTVFLGQAARLNNHYDLALAYLF